MFHRGANLVFFYMSIVVVFVDFLILKIKTMDSLAVLDLFLYICGWIK